MDTNNTTVYTYFYFARYTNANLMVESILRLGMLSEKTGKKIANLRVPYSAGGLMVEFDTTVTLEEMEELFHDLGGSPFKVATSESCARQAFNSTFAQHSHGFRGPNFGNPVYGEGYQQVQQPQAWLQANQSYNEERFESIERQLRLMHTNLSQLIEKINERD